MSQFQTISVNDGRFVLAAIPRRDTSSHLAIGNGRSNEWPALVAGAISEFESDDDNRWSARSTLLFAVGTALAMWSGIVFAIWA